jgi:nanoRNase/pAp phosphatase (c-di-AMP/oligoRNAs hydrolase)
MRRNFASFRQFSRPDRDLGAAPRQFLLEAKGKLVKTELEGRTCYSIGLTLKYTGAVLAGVKRLGSEGGHSTASGVEAKNVKITTPTRILMARFKKA